jgi:predicted PurR-regulated permease PerM
MRVDEQSSSTLNADGEKGTGGAPKGSSSLRFWKIFFIGLIAAVSVLFVYLVRRFIMPLLLAAITASLFYPLRQRFLGWFRGRRGLASAAMTVIVVLVVVIPAGGIGYFVIEDSVRIGKHFTENIQAINEQLSSFIGRLNTLPLMEKLDFSKYVKTDQLTVILQDIGGSLLKSTGKIAEDILRIVLLTFIFLYCLFFFFKDGETMLRRIFMLIPMPRSEKDKIFGGFVSVTRAIIKNTLVIGAIQGFIGGLTFFLLGLQGPVLWGLLIMFLSAIPNIGAAIIWLPAALFLFATGRTLHGSILFAVGVCIIGTVDYILRPYMIGELLNIHKILILFGVLGGIALFGLFGIIIGPIIVSVFVTLLNIYEKTFRKELRDITQ